MDINEFKGMDEIHKTKTDLMDGMLFNDRYELVRQLGRGAFGEVWKATDRDSETEVAIKLLPRELSHSPAEFEKVKENYQLVHTLAHPNIATYKDLVKYVRPNSKDSDFGYFLVMEYVEGSTLDLYVNDNFARRQCPLDKAIMIGKQIADALDFAHKKSIVHRDIKPENIMIDKEGDVKLLDFGLAAQVKTSMNRVSKQVADSSGTMQYMSPEQWRGRRQTGMADQYALGCLMYELISGEVPFDVKDSFVMRGCALDEIPERLLDQSDQINDALLKALAKKPEDRFANCREFIDALAGKIEVVPNSSFEIEGNVPVKKGLSGKVIILLLFLIIAGGVGYWRYTENERAKAIAAEEEERKAREQEEEEQKAREQEEKEQRAKEQQEKEQKAREQEEKEQRAKEQQEKEQKAREQEAREQKAREQEAREQEAREQEAREQKAREQKAREQKEKEQRAKELEEKEQRAKELEEEKQKAKDQKEEERFNSYYISAKSHYDNGNFTLAKIEVDKALETHGYEFSHKGLSLKKLIVLRLNAQLEASEEYSKEVDDGDKAADEKNYPSAIAHYTKALGIITVEDKNSTVSKLKKIRKIQNNILEEDYKAHMKAGNDYLEAGDYKSSEESFRSALGIDGYSKDADAIGMLSNVISEQLAEKKRKDKLSKAVSDLKIARENNDFLELVNIIEEAKELDGFAGNKYLVETARQINKEVVQSQKASEEYDKLVSLAKIYANSKDWEQAEIEIINAQEVFSKISDPRLRDSSIADELLLVIHQLKQAENEERKKNSEILEVKLAEIDNALSSGVLSSLDVLISEAGIIPGAKSDPKFLELEKKVQNVLIDEVITKIEQAFLDKRLAQSRSLLEVAKKMKGAESSQRLKDLDKKITQAEVDAKHINTKLGDIELALSNKGFDKVEKLIDEIKTKYPDVRNNQRLISFEKQLAEEKKGMVDPNDPMAELNRFNSQAVEEINSVIKERGGSVDISAVTAETTSSSSGVDGAALNDQANRVRGSDKRRAVELYEQAAAAGHGGAQGNLGRIYYFGTMGVRKDMNRAFSLLSSSASQGDRDSQFILGDMYAKGKGTPKNNKQAARLYKQAADQGHREAKSKYKRFKKYLK